MSEEDRRRFAAVGGWDQFRKLSDLRPEINDRWYEAFADAVHFLGKRWPDQLTEWEEGFCEREADRAAPRPETERVSDGSWYGR